MKASYRKTKNGYVITKGTLDECIEQAESKLIKLQLELPYVSRRFLEEKAKNPTITLEEITNQIIERDKLDKERKIAPLVVPKNAIIVDSTSKTIGQVVDCLLSHISL